MTTIGIDVESSRRSLEIAIEHSIFASVGLHPNDAEDLSSEVESQLREMVAADRVVAVGESGLDFYRDSATPEAQYRAFDLHIQLAKEHDKALVIHTRDSIDEAIAHLRQVGAPQRFVFHCWSGDEDQLRAALELDAYVSFAGNVSFKSAENLRVAARLVPADRILVETDSPYLSPVPERGKPNEPARVALVGAAVAGARGVDDRVLAASTSENARKFFALS
ncbi:MAG: TatD DNase family protein [Actinomycetota bacterium]|nr:TatD DNase family protein [Actinomycetota bacterium]